MDNIKPNGKKYTKGQYEYTETIYGSFVNSTEYGSTQQKNALSERELIKYGYKLSE